MVEVRRKEWPMTTFVAWTVGVVNKHGFLRKRCAVQIGSPSTRERVLDLLRHPFNPKRTVYEPGNAEWKEALSIVRWLLNLSDAVLDRNSRLNTLRLIATAGVVHDREAAVAVTAVAEYRKQKSGVS